MTSEDRERMQFLCKRIVEEKDPETTSEAVGRSPVSQVATTPPRQRNQTGLTALRAHADAGLSAYILTLSTTILSSSILPVSVTL